MGRLLATTAVIAFLSASTAAAGGVGPPPVSPTSTTGSVTFLLGLAVEFGDPQPNLGITGKVLVAPFSNGIVVGGGVTYLPNSTQQFGVDVSGGVNLGGVAVLGGYDFLTQQPQVSVGIAPTSSTLTCPPNYTLSGGLCYPPSPSDRRLKREIVHLATLGDGVKLYSFRYLWSEIVYVGVMAQDLLDDSRLRHAVSTGEDGFYLVDYDALNLVMVTLDVWNEHGVEAMVLGSRRPELLVAEAA
ncbi:MAG: hypothetical protein ABI697_11210 [Devosia sp.]